MKNKDILGSLLSTEVVKTAKTFYRDDKLEVTMSGQTAYTNGKVINVPAVNQGRTFTPKEVDVFRGYVDHEAAHKRHTNFRAGQKYRKLLAEIPHLGAIENALEDVRIERLATKEYPGALHNINATREAVNTEALEMFDKDPVAAHDFPKTCAVALTWEGSKRIGYATPTNGQLLDLLPDEHRALLSNAIDRLDDCRKTKDVYELALTLCEEWDLIPVEEPEEPEQPEEPEEPEEPEQPDEEGEPEPEEEGEEESEEGEQESEEGEQEPEDTPEEEEEGDDGDDGEEGEEGEPTEAEAGQDTGDGTEDESEEPTEATRAVLSDALSPELAQAIDQFIDKDKSGEAKRQRYQVAWPENDFVFDMLNPPPQQDDASGWNHWLHYLMFEDVHHKTDRKLCYKVAGGVGFDNDWLDGMKLKFNQEADKALADATASVRPNVNRAKKHLLRALLSRQDRAWANNKDEGFINPRHLAKAMTGSNEVYRIRGEAEDIDTAVTLLIDASGSMSEYGKDIAALQSAMLLAEVLEAINVPFSVAWFHCHDYTHRYRKEHGIKQKGKSKMTGAARIQPSSLVISKNWQTTLKRARRSIAALKPFTGYNNADGTALMRAYEHLLLPRPESKKIMIVFSDGNPITREYWYQEEYYLAEVTKWLEQRIHLFGVGILDRAVEDYYSSHIVINNVEELASSGIKILADQIIGGKKRAA